MTSSRPICARASGGARAGGYAIQGLFGAFVPEIVGSYTNVVGLPLAETAALLTGMGYRVPYETAPI